MQKQGCNIATVVLLKLQGCVVSYMQVLATMHNILLDHYSWKNLILATCFWGSDVGM